MADNVTVDNGVLTDYVVSADEIVATGELLQRVKLAYSADGVATHVQADADGLLVNLGANNDVTIASLPLPTGAATAAKQPALGTAGTPSADVISIQGVVSGTVVPVSDGGGSLTVDGPLTDTQLRATAVPVSLASVPSHAVTNAGTFATQENGAALTALQLIDNASVAHDAAVVAGVTQIGLDARSTDPTAVASGDATRALATLLGKQVVYPYALPGATWNYAAVSGGITTTTAVTIKAAAGAGIRNYIAHLDVVNAHATVSTEVVIRDGAAGTVIWRGYCMAAGGGYSIDFVNPLRSTANTLLEVAAITTGAAVYVNATGFVAAE